MGNVHAERDWRSPGAKPSGAAPGLDGPPLLAEFYHARHRNVHRSVWIEMVDHRIREVNIGSATRNFERSHRRYRYSSGNEPPEHGQIP